MYQRRLGLRRMHGCITQTMIVGTQWAPQTRASWQALMRSSDRTGKTLLHISNEDSFA